MATKYFNGEIELTRIQALANAEFARSFPGVKGRKYDGFSMQVGQPIDFKPVWDGVAYTKRLLPVERVINYKVAGSKHVCDARCMYAKGRTMNCECACGGKNHGRGGFIAEAA